MLLNLTVPTANVRAFNIKKEKKILYMSCLVCTQNY